jgi:hypothetical protein
VSTALRRSEKSVEFIGSTLRDLDIWMVFSVILAAISTSSPNFLDIVNMGFLWCPMVSCRGLAAEATTQQLQSTLCGRMVHIAGAGSALDGRSRAADVAVASSKQ